MEIHISEADLPLFYFFVGLGCVVSGPFLLFRARSLTARQLRSHRASPFRKMKTDHRGWTLTNRLMGAVLILFGLLLLAQSALNALLD